MKVYDGISVMNFHLGTTNRATFVINFTLWFGLCPSLIFIQGSKTYTLYCRGLWWISVSLLVVGNPLFSLPAIFYFFHLCVCVSQLVHFTHDSEAQPQQKFRKHFRCFETVWLQSHSSCGYSRTAAKRTSPKRWEGSAQTFLPYCRRGYPNGRWLLLWGMLPWCLT